MGSEPNTLSDTPQTPTQQDSDFLKTIVTHLFEPGSESGESNTFDFLSLSDALNSVRENTFCDAQTLYSLMISMGFTTRTIDGVIYWVVKS